MGLGGRKVDPPTVSLRVGRSFPHTRKPIKGQKEWCQIRLWNLEFRGSGISLMWKADLCCPPLVNIQGKIQYVPGRGWAAQALRIRGRMSRGGQCGQREGGWLFLEHPCPGEASWVTESLCGHRFLPWKNNLEESRMPVNLSPC